MGSETVVLVLLVAVWWCVVASVCGKLGQRKGHVWGNAFFVALFLSPGVGLLYCVALPDWGGLSDAERAKRERGEPGDPER